MPHTVITRRIDLDTRLVERKAVRAIVPMIGILRGRIVAQASIKEVSAELVELLTDVALFSHLLGMKRSFSLRPKSKSLSLSLLTASVKALEDQLGVATKVLKAQYVRNVLKSVKDLTKPAEEEIRDELIIAQKEGLHVSPTIKNMQARFDEMNVKANAETLVRTQTQLAYNAGRWQADQDPVIQDILWGYEYVAITDDRVRPEHEAFDGTVLPKEDPFWKANWPPNGWNCRCTTIPLFEPERKKAPSKLPDGSVAKPDKGFVGNAGVAIVKPKAFLTPAQEAFNEGVRKEKAARRQKDLEKRGIRKPKPKPKPKPKVVKPLTKTEKLRKELAATTKLREEAEGKMAKAIARAGDTLTREPTAKSREPTRFKGYSKREAVVVGRRLERTVTRLDGIVGKHSEGAIKHVTLSNSDAVKVGQNGAAGGFFPDGRMSIATKRATPISAKPTLGVDKNAKHPKGTTKRKKLHWTVGESVDDVTRHEYGHAMHEQVWKDKKARTEFEMIYKKNKNDVSYYAATNQHEFFAESFGAWTHPNYEQGTLPKDVEKYLERNFKPKAATQNISKTAAQVSKVVKQHDLDKFAKVHKTASKALRVVVDDYVQGDFESINTKLRKGQKLSIKEQGDTKALAGIIKSQKALKSPVEVFRGVHGTNTDVKKQLAKIQKVIQDDSSIEVKQFWSTSLDPGIAREFASAQGIGGAGSNLTKQDLDLVTGYVYKIRTKQGLYIGDLSDLEEEREMLLGIGQKFRPTKIAAEEFRISATDKVPKRVVVIHMEAI